jgi:polysaccharide export outer membrane protein
MCTGSIFHEARSTKAIARVVAVGCLITLLVACARPSPPPPPQIQAGERDEYIIGIPDLLSIRVWKNPDLSIQVPVRKDGKISVPLLDDIQAEGLTPEELKEVISEALSEFITAPDVTVIVSQANSQTVTVVGALGGRSGSLPLSRETRVLEAIAAMGGFNTWARRNDVRILRDQDGEIVSYRFNYGAYVAGKAPDSNIFLMPGDTIVVPD